MRKWYDIIKKVAVPKIILILVENKVDLSDMREISAEEGMELTKEFEVYYVETSAKRYENTERFFEWIALQISTLIVRQLKILNLTNK